MSAPFPNGMLISLTSLRAQNEGAEVALTLKIEAGDNVEHKRLVISTEQYGEIKPRRGPLSAEEYDVLDSAAALYAAVKRGEGILSYSSNSMRMLAKKLCEKGYGREAAERAAQILKEKGLINEKSDIEREIERCVRKLWGAARIRSHLWTKGFERELLADLDALLENVDFAENCARLIRQKYKTIPTDAAERRRMIAALARYGYSMSEIKAAISSLQ